MTNRKVAMQNLNKILIAGPGRSGTTFLVKLFHYLGYECGFTEALIEEHYEKKWRAGLEWNIVWTGDNRKDQELVMSSPYVIKGPEIGVELKELLERKVIKLDHLIIPVRDLEVSARSRMNVGLKWLTESDDVKNQEYILAYVLGRNIEAAVLYDIPITLIRFPDIVRSEHYCWKKLRPILHTLPKNNVKRITRKDFRKIYKKVANPKQIQTK